MREIKTGLGRERMSEKEIEKIKMTGNKQKEKKIRKKKEKEISRKIERKI